MEATQLGTTTNVMTFGNLSLPKGTPARPLASFTLFAYNQEAFIREAIRGAFAQSYSPLEIILSDDCSTDRTPEIMYEMASSYVGVHLVRLARNRSNLGIANHVNKVFTLAQGEIIIIAAGDDISLPNRAETTVALFNANPDCSAVLLSADVINHQGSKTGAEHLLCDESIGTRRQTLSDITSFQFVTFGASRAIRRSTWLRFPPLSPTCPTEDTPLLLRSLMCGSNILSSDKVLLYRVHESSISSPFSMRKLDISSISCQYYSDIDHAFYLDIISYRAHRSLSRWVKQQQTIRSLRNQISTNAKLGLLDILRMIASPGFRIKEKLWALIAFFLHSNRGSS